jgi:hypothetical protein
MDPKTTKHYLYFISIWLRKCSEYCTCKYHKHCFTKKILKLFSDCTYEVDVQSAFIKKIAASIFINCSRDLWENVDLCNRKIFLRSVWWILLELGAVFWISSMGNYFSWQLWFEGLILRNKIYLLYTIRFHQNLNIFW